MYMLFSQYGPKRRTIDMSNIQNSFTTNQEKFLSEIINGILPKSNSVDILVEYFYYSGSEQIYSNLKDKKIRVLVGLEVDTLISNKAKEIDSFIKTNQSREQSKDSYYSSLISIWNKTDSFDSEEKLDASEMQEAVRIIEQLRALVDNLSN